MTKQVLLVALLAVAAACSARPASQGDADQATNPMIVAPLALEPPPVYALIGYRDRLELTSQQVTTLDSLATAVREENGILIDSLRARAITRNNNPGVLQVNPAERPILDRIRQNNRRVLDRLTELLTPEQEAEVCELYEQDRPAEPTRGPRRTNQADQEDAFRRGNPSRTDSTAIVRPFSVWPWCAAAGPAGQDSTRRGSS